MNGLTIFIFSKPSADTSARRPASKRGEDRTTGGAIGYILASFYVCNRAFIVFIFRSVPAFRTLPRKNRARESAASFLPSRRFRWAQVQTGGAITAEPYACRPIIKIIESHKNRVPSDNLITIIGSQADTDSRKGSQATAAKTTRRRPRALYVIGNPVALARPSVRPCIRAGKRTSPRHP